MEKNKVLAKYFVCDCEHEGDISRACKEVRELGGKVITTEWDGEDCGEAYIYCLIDKDKFDELSKDSYEWSSSEYMRNYFKKKNWI